MGIDPEALDRRLAYRRFLGPEILRSHFEAAGRNQDHSGARTFRPIVDGEAGLRCCRLAIEIARGKRTRENGDGAAGSNRNRHGGNEAAKGSGHDKI
jgi:hypothetical protein